MKKILLICLCMLLSISHTVFANANNDVLNCKAQNITNNMTLSEKVGQMLMLDFRIWRNQEQTEVKPFTEMSSEVAQIIHDYKLGGVILFHENLTNTEQTIHLIDGLQEVANPNVPLFIGVDQEGGSTIRPVESTFLPGNMALGATRNPNYSYLSGKIIGKELAALGVNIDFAPDLDVNNNPDNPVINIRSFGSDPDLVSQMGVKMMEGIQSEGIIATAKHFPGHGDTAADSHTGLPVVNKSLTELKKMELKPFTVAINNGLDVLMTAHIQFPQIESQTVVSKKDGQQIYLPATLSPRILTDLVRNDLKFDGVVITDALDMKAITDNFGEVESVKRAINAGADILLMCTTLRSLDDVPKLNKLQQSIITAVENGEITQSRIDEAVNRIIKLKLKRGIIKENAVVNSTTKRIENAKNVIGTEANHQLERRITDDAITVVKNSNRILPFKPESNEKILYISPMKELVLSFDFALKRLVKENKIGQFKTDTYCYERQNQISAELKQKIDLADYIIVVSADFGDKDKKEWFSVLPKAIVEYANQNNKKLVVISVFNPYDCAYLSDAPAFVIAYGCFGMQESNRTVLTASRRGYGPNILSAIDVVFGAVSAKGKLPIDVPEYKHLTKLLYGFGYGVK